MGGGAWPFLVGGVICLVNSDNERDSVLLTSSRVFFIGRRGRSLRGACVSDVAFLPSGVRVDSHEKFIFLEGLAASSRTRLSNNRSVMPLDVLGRTRATLKGSACVFPFLRRTGNPLNPFRGRDRGLQFFPVNQECPVSASHKLALITSLPFVHTARRYYRLNVLVRYLDWTSSGSRQKSFVREDSQT